MATIETCDNNQNEMLKTHYYRNDFEMIRVIIEKKVKSSDYQIFRADNNYNEILVETKDFTTIFFIVSVTPICNSIDICVTSKSFFKNSKTHIASWYEILDKALDYLGKGQR